MSVYSTDSLAGLLPEKASSVSNFFSMTSEILNFALLFLKAVDSGALGAKLFSN